MARTSKKIKDETKTGISVFDSNGERQSLSTQTRNHVMDCALQLIMKDGIQGLTLAGVAQAAKITKQRLAYHYREIDTLLVDLFRLTASLGQRFTLERLAQANSPREKVLAVVQGAFDWMRIHPHFGRFFLLIYAVAPQSPHVMDTHRQVVETGRARLEGLLGQFLAAERARELSLVIQSVIVGHVFRMVSIDETQEMNRVEAATLGCVRALLDEAGD